MTRTLTLAALAFTLVLPALAAGPMGQGPMMQAEQGPGTMHGMCAMGSARHVEGSLAFLKTELKIAAAQTAAWDAFATAFREAKGGGGQMPMMMPNGMMGGGKPAQPLPERMALHRQIMEAHLAQMAKLQPAVEKLYSALSAEQKRTADEIMPMSLMCRMM